LVPDRRRALRPDAGLLLLRARAPGRALRAGAAPRRRLLRRLRADRRGLRAGAGRPPGRPHALRRQPDPAARPLGDDPRPDLERAELARDGFLDQAGIDSLLQQQAAGRADNGNRLWLLLNAEAWYRMHIRGEGREAMAERIAAQAPAEPAADRAA